MITLTLIILFLFRLSKSYYKGPKSDHFDGKYFFNPNFKHDISKKSIFDLFKWKFFKKKKNSISWPKNIPLKDYPIPPRNIFGSEISVTNIGHATFLIQVDGLNILTDPIWAERASPFSFLGPKRVVKPGVEFEKLPKIDVVWISHNHYDHLDLKTLQKLWQVHKPRIIVPLGTNTSIIYFDKKIEVESYDWHDEIEISKTVKFHLEPSNHWSARHILDQRKALWSALVIETSAGNIYFAGDTCYDNGINFQNAKNKFEKFSLAILPMGAYEPRWFMKHVHMNPEDFILAHIDLGMPVTIPCHYDVFKLTDENYGQAIIDLNVAMEKHKIDKSISPIGIGESKLF